MSAPALEAVAGLLRHQEEVTVVVEGAAEVDGVGVRRCFQRLQTTRIWRCVYTPGSDDDPLG